MPTSLREILIEMFRVRPEFAADLLGVLGHAVPAHAQARVESAEFTDVVPTEYRADIVVVLSQGDDEVLAVVVEVQLGYDDEKQWIWPVYLTSLRRRLRCPVRLLVLCTDRRVAARYAPPIDLGDGDRITPRVLGPDAVPVIVDPAAAEGRTQGRTEGLAAAVLDVFDARDVPVATADRERILACTDETRIRTWLRAAVTAGSAAELLAE